jgi:hypothetical protein
MNLVVVFSALVMSVVPIQGLESVGHARLA